MDLFGSTVWMSSMQSHARPKMCQITQLQVLGRLLRYLIPQSQQNRQTIFFYQDMSAISIEINDGPQRPLNKKGQYMRSSFALVWAHPQSAPVSPIARSTNNILKAIINNKINICSTNSFKKAVYYNILVLQQFLTI